VPRIQAPEGKDNDGCQTGALAPPIKSGSAGLQRGNPNLPVIPAWQGDDNAVFQAGLITVMTGDARTVCSHFIRVIRVIRVSAA
jgi:hypothetical protein